MPATYPPREGCTALIDSVLATEGRIDVLCNNAGINRRGPLLSITPEDWRLSFAVNIDAMFHLCQAALPQMIAQGGGAIVNTASQWGLYPAPNHIAYNVTKAAVASFTQNLARDYAPQKIHDDPRRARACVALLRATPLPSKNRTRSIETEARAARAVIESLHDAALAVHSAWLGRAARGVLVDARARFRAAWPAPRSLRRCCPWRGRRWADRFARGRRADRPS